MKNYKSDKKYWIQFDEDIHNLPINNIILLSSPDETNRIKELLWDSVDNERLKVGIAFSYYDIYQFLSKDYYAYLILKDMDSLDDIINIVHNSEDVDNLCIIECRDDFIPIKKEFKKLDSLYTNFGTIFSTVKNTEIKSKYRINFLYKN